MKASSAATDGGHTTQYSSVASRLSALPFFWVLIVRFECCRAAAAAAMVGHIGAASGRFLKTLAQNFLPDGPGGSVGPSLCSF